METPAREGTTIEEGKPNNGNTESDVPFALCRYCGTISRQLAKCDCCKRVLDNPKIIMKPIASIKKAYISKVTFYRNNSPSNLRLIPTTAEIKSKSDLIAKEEHNKLGDSGKKSLLKSMETPAREGTTIEEGKPNNGTDVPFALCPYCGTVSRQLAKCDCCKRVLDNPKIIMKPIDSIKKAYISKVTFYRNNSPSNLRLIPTTRAVIEAPPILNNVEKKSTPKRAPCYGRRRKKEEAHVCLTISSDEEGAGNLEGSPESSKKLRSAKVVPCQADSSSGNNLSPVSFVEHYEAPVTHSSAAQVPQVTLKVRSCELDCRSIWIGSYKVNPNGKILIDSTSIICRVKPVGDDEFVQVTIDTADLVKCLAHFGEKMPVMFIYTNPASASIIREGLRMTTRDGPYYDPSSKDETQMRITFVVVSLDEKQAKTLSLLFKDLNNRLPTFTFTEIDQKVANDILSLDQRRLQW